MPHLSERLAEFVFEELSPSEMAESRRHLAECSRCREEINQFQTTYAMLKTSPDTEPPRRIMFEFEKPRAGFWIWRWLAPMMASAAVALAVVNFAPRPQPQIVERVVQQSAVTQPAPAAAQPIDYQKAIDELRASDRAWLENELRKRDAAQTREIERVRGEVALLDALQRKVWEETIQHGNSIQLLAKR